ncbi:MAG: chemotaxis-specific protein-glutamate methyltransferase CheB [Planctomycetota bacterium]
MIRVLIVDDSLATRSAVSRALSREMDLEVLRPASSGAVAIERTIKESPDVVVLDVDMPGIDGLEVLDELCIRKPGLPVIMFSGLTERGAEITLDALARGATDVLAKPADGGDVAETMALLARKVRELGSGRERREARARPRRGSQTVEAVVVGVSTGGPNAMADLLPRFRGDLAAPILVVQHMPPVFTRQFAERLDRRSALRVREAQHGDVVAAGDVWIAPGDRHMSIERRGTEVVIELSDGPEENSCRPAVDVLFRSAAACYGDGALGVVLTGMGQDGFCGSQSLVAAGAQVIAQDEETSVVWGMPGAVVRGGLAARVLPLPMIAGEIERRVRCGHPPQSQEVSR